ncbi:60S Ribosomal Protein L39-Like 5-Like [Manis pentadactyla]|nr:60S Ribosomal Protein L39-Like 5-Like [Manis pentadactyla]
MAAPCSNGQRFCLSDLEVLSNVLVTLTLRIKQFLAKKQKQSSDTPQGIWESARSVSRDRRLERARSFGPQQRLTASLFPPRLLALASTRPGREWIRSLAGAGAAETWKHGSLSQREPPRLLRRPRLLLFRSATRSSARELESICPPAETGCLEEMKA